MNNVLQDLSPPQARKFSKFAFGMLDFYCGNDVFVSKNTKNFRPAAGKSDIKGPPFICFFGVSDLLRNKGGFVAKGGGVCCSD